MKTVIVPIDFSDTSVNAAEYAVHFLAGHSGIEIILYHCYEMDYGDVNALENLENLKNRLLEIAPVEFTLHVEQSDEFLLELEKLARHRQADLVIMARQLLRDPYFPLHAAKELGTDVPWPVQYERAKK